jgi:tight adherence protein B
MLATLTLAVVGVGVLVGEQQRRHSLSFAFAPARESRLRSWRLTVERRVRRTRYGKRLRWLLDNADLGWPILDTLATAGAALLILTVVSYQIGGPVFAIVIGIMLIVGARSWFQRREERRFTKFIDQLPDLARLLANAAGAGLSLRAGLTVAAQETAEPTKGELKQVVDELNLGATLEDALERMGERLPSRELAVLVNVLIIQARAGGKIVTALRGITEALESRRDVRREVATLTAGSRATVVAVSAIGGMMVLMVHTTVHGGLRALLANPVGLAIFLVSLGMFLLGMWLVRRAVKIEV